MKDSLALLEHPYRLEIDQYRSYIPNLYYLESMPPNGTCSLENSIKSVDWPYSPSNNTIIKYCKMMRDVPEGVRIPPIDPSLAE